MRAAPDLSHVSASDPRRAFTLFELLIVISIIAILAGILYPAISSSLGRAKEARAESMATNLQTAIEAYYTEYRRYPAEDLNTDTDAVLVRSDNELMDILCASDAHRGPGGMNPRGTVFYSGNTAKRKANGGYRNGIRMSEDGSAELFDPWGEYFYVLMDANGDHRIAKPKWDERSASRVIPKSILVWSTGPDLINSEQNLQMW